MIEPDLPRGLSSNVSVVLLDFPNFKELYFRNYRMSPLPILHLRCSDFQRKLLVTRLVSRPKGRGSLYAWIISASTSLREQYQHFWRCIRWFQSAGDENSLVFVVWDGSARDIESQVYIQAPNEFGMLPVMREIRSFEDDPSSPESYDPNLMLDDEVSVQDLIKSIGGFNISESTIILSHRNSSHTYQIEFVEAKGDHRISVRFENRIFHAVA